MKINASEYVNTTKKQNRHIEQNLFLMQKVIFSNEELMKSQSQIIKSLGSQILAKQKQIANLNQKLKDLQKSMNLSKQQIEIVEKLAKMELILSQMQQQLVQTKIQLAIKSSQVLEKQAEIKGLITRIKNLEDEKSQLITQNQELQRISAFSEADNDDRTSKNPSLEVTKDNLTPNFLKITQENFNLNKLRTNEGQNTKNQLIGDPIMKLWTKYVEEQIIQSKIYISNLSINSNEQRLQKFIKTTFPLLKKSSGVPHNLRNKVWDFISQDRLSLSNSLYLQFLDRRNRGWVTQIMKRQIQNDINRSFNGQGSIQKLNNIRERSMSKNYSQQEPKPIQQRKSSYDMEFQDKKTADNQISKLSNFRISEDVTEVLELFYIYRPDIGYVQGMTYPVIILTLVTGKLSAFRIICNLLLMNDFFKKMITFEPNFINYFCRIFDQLLEIELPKLYQLIIKQFRIKSQIFLVDWFFTFFSRGISPKTILKVWDLLLYQNSISKNPQTILYRVSLSIFRLLESIILQTTDQECIQSVREYYKKIDEEELINNVYGSIKDNSVQKSFDQKFERIKSRLEKKSLGNY